MRQLIPTIEKRLNQRAKALYQFRPDRIAIINICRNYIQRCYGQPDNIIRGIIRFQILPHLRNLTPHQKSNHHHSWTQFICDIESQLNSESQTPQNSNYGS